MISKRVALASALVAVVLMYLLLLRKRKGWTIEDLFSTLDVFDGFLIAWSFSFLLLTVKFGFTGGLLGNGLSYFTLFWSGITLFLFRRNIKAPKSTMLLLVFLIFFAVLFTFDEIWVILDDVINRRPFSIYHLVVDHIRNISIVIFSLIISLKSGKLKIHLNYLLFSVLFTGSMYSLWVLEGFPDFRFSDSISVFMYWFASMRLGLTFILCSIKIDVDAEVIESKIGL